jgi:glycosyltransferase involved in cell wall biosynthesis
VNLKTSGIAESYRPLVSVVIPAFNSAAYIAQCLDSVLQQTFSDFEIIVVNDGSPDTPSLELALSPYRSSIRYIVQENQGPSAARNRAISVAKGTYLAFLDSDDFWDPGHLAAQVDILMGNSRLGLVYGNVWGIEDGRVLGTSFDKSPQCFPVTFEALITEECSIGTSSVVVSREAVLAAGLFDEQLNRCEDLDLWLRLSHRGVAMAWNPVPRVYHRKFNGLSSKRLMMKRSQIEVCERFLCGHTLSPAQQWTVRQKTTSLQAEIDLELAKVALGASEYHNARSAAERALQGMRNWKLDLALACLRTVPRFVCQSYAGYGHLLSLRNKKSTLMPCNPAVSETRLRQISAAAGN